LPRLAQLFFQRTDEGLQRLDSSPVLVLGFDNRPRTVARGSSLDHFNHGLTIGRPARTVAPIFSGDLMAFVWHSLTFFESPQLLFGADVHPKFHQHRPCFRLVTLKLVDLLVSAAPFGFCGKSLDAFNEHTAVPTAIENGNVAGLG